MKENQIYFGKYQFGEVEGICMKLGDTCFIGVVEGLSEIREREVVAHEIGHTIDGTDRMIGILLAERRADKLGRELLIPKSKLVQAIEENDGNCDTCYLSQIFGVPTEMMQARVRDVFNI